MAFPDDPVGGILGVRPIGQDGRTRSREKGEEGREGRRITRKTGHDRVTLSVEARKLSLEGGKEQVGDSSEDEADQDQEKNC